MGDSVVGPCAVARFAGSTALVGIAILGLAPQALCCRPLRGLNRVGGNCDPGACVPGFMLSPASRADSQLSGVVEDVEVKQWVETRCTSLCIPLRERAD